MQTRTFTRVTVALCALAALTITAPANAATACFDLGGNISANGTCQTLILGERYEIEYSFPDDFPDQSALSQYLGSERDRFIAEVADLRPRDVPYQLEATPSTYGSDLRGGTTSLVLKFYRETGGTRPTTYYKAFTWDLASARPVTFDTLFNQAAAPLSVISPLVRRDLEQSGHVVPSSFDEAGVDLYSNFALTDSDVIFFIGQGDVLSAADGPLEVTVPLREVQSVLA